MAQKFINIDRDTPMLLPPDLRDWIPDGHMVHFILDVVQSMNHSAFQINHRGTGNAQYPPSMMLSLLVYCYATGRFSSRVIEEATRCDVAVRYICAGTHPDHDTICTFRRVNRKAFEKFFVHVLEVAAQSGVMKKVGTVSVDGTKIHANASKHSAVSYGRAQQILEQLKAEVTILMQKAEQADSINQPECEVSLPDEIARREQRKAQIEKALSVIEARNQEKLEEKRRECKSRQDDRTARRDRGETVTGPDPKEPSIKIETKSQYNFTDPESRIMKGGSGQHFDQCYNAQAAVDVESMLIVSNQLSDSPLDIHQLLPTLDAASQNGFTVEKVLADTGYYSEANTAGCQARDVDPYIATGKQSHGRKLEDILGESALPDLRDNATPKERMAHKLKQKECDKLYRLRKQTVEPVFGIIKQGMRFRQFLMRGKEKVTGEWNLVCCAYNLKRTFNLTQARQATALSSCPVETA